MMTSPLSKRPRMFSPKNNNNDNSNNNRSSSTSSSSGKNEVVLSPVINRRKGYNTYVNNLRKEMNRAQKVKSNRKNKGCDNDDTTTKSSSSGNKKGSNSLLASNHHPRSFSSSTIITSICVKEAGSKGKSQLCSAKLVASTNGTFVLTIPSSQEEDNNNDDDDGSSSSSSNDDNDIFDEMFRMEDEENEDVSSI
ncbi:hypothetical protein ACHAXM_000163 [Skeletonema potamos]